MFRENVLLRVRLPHTLIERVLRKRYLGDSSSRITEDFIPTTQRKYYAIFHFCSCPPTANRQGHTCRLVLHSEETTPPFMLLCVRLAAKDQSFFVLRAGGGAGPVESMFGAFGDWWREKVIKPIHATRIRLPPLMGIPASSYMGFVRVVLGPR